MEKIPDLRERPTDYQLTQNQDGSWLLVGVDGTETPFVSGEIAQEIQKLLVTQTWSDSISKDAVPGKLVPQFMILQ